MRIRLVLFALSAPLLLTLNACSTPTFRAAKRPATFGRLSPSDKKLVLHGRVRLGMDKDTVYIAWGAPDWRFADGKSKQAAESWIYERELSTYAPMGSYDQAFPSANFYGPRGTYSIPPSFGSGGVPNAGFNSSPRLILTDVRFKRADFVDDHLRRYEVRRGSRHLTVTATDSAPYLESKAAAHHPKRHHRQAQKKRGLHRNPRSAKR